MGGNDNRRGPGPSEAYKTTQKVEAWRLGIFGSVMAGVNKEWRSRIKPLQLAKGVLETITAIAIFAITIYFTLLAGYSLVLLLVPSIGGFLLA